VASLARPFSCDGNEFISRQRLSLAIACIVHVAIGCGGSSPQAAGAAGSSPAGSGGGAGTGGATAGTGGGAAGTGGSSVPRVQTCVPPADRNAPPQKLSETGCVNASDPKVLASSVVPYEVNSPLWSDGADKLRGMALPTNGKIHVINCAANPTECPGTRGHTDDGKWLLPAGTVMVKSFLFDNKLLETRLLVRFDATTWVGYTYKWDEAQTDATLVGTERDEVMFATGARMVHWYYPSRRDCMRCHLEEASFALGTETAQMNRVVGGTNQIDRLAAMDAFDAPVPKPYKAALVAPYASQAGTPPASATIEQRATSYLHANCSFCHRPNDDVDCTSEPCLDLRFGLALANRSMCNVAPGKGDYGIAGAMTLAPGSPAKSMMVYRMNAPADDNNGKYGRMPLIASYVVDQPAVDLISSWITSITACP
jgi:hypothetical protein